MVAGKRLREIDHTRRLLSLQADIHRTLVAVEVRQVEQSLAWVDSIRRAASVAAPAAPIVSGVAGLFAAGSWRSLWRWVPLGFSAFRLAKQFRGFWKQKPGS